jgi:hypothetical protein
MLLTGSGDEFCGPLPALLQAVTYHLPAVSPSAFLAVYWSSHGNQLLALPPFFSALSEFLTPLLCFQFFVIQFCGVVGGVCRGVGQSAQGAMLVYLRGGWGNIAWHLALIYLVCWMSPKQVWSRHLAAAVALLFSQCNVAWRSLPQARGSGCQSFDSPWCFISTNYGSGFSARFLIHGAHAVCFWTLVAVLDPSGPYFLNPTPQSVSFDWKSESINIQNYIIIFRIILKSFHNSCHFVVLFSI